MKKLIIWILFLLLSCQPAWAEIRVYNITDIKDSTIHNLVIEGLGAGQGTISCPSLGIAAETPIYPMDKLSGGGVDGYYLLSPNGIAVIELKGDAIKFYELGGTQKTLVGSLKRINPNQQ